MLEIVRPTTSLLEYPCLQGIQIFKNLLRSHRAYLILITFTFVLTLYTLHIQQAYSQSIDPARESDITSDKANFLAEHWWKSFMEMPANDNNPALDPTGSACHSADLNNVTFLVGTLRSDQERHCIIDSGKYIYFAHGYECNPLEYKLPSTFDSLITCARNYEEKEIGAGSIFKVTLDGREITDVKTHKVESSETFDIEFPSNAIFGAPTGTAPTAAITYYILFKPLAKGEHLLTAQVNSNEKDMNGKDPYAWIVKYYLDVR